MDAPFLLPLARLVGQLPILTAVIPHAADGAAGVLNEGMFLLEHHALGLQIPEVYMPHPKISAAAIPFSSRCCFPAGRLASGRRQ